MKIGLRVLLGYFLIVAVAALLLVNVFVQQVKPGVRQAMEDTLADTANVLAELASDDLLAGRINQGQFAGRIRSMGQREIGARIWGQPKHAPSYRITVTDARGIVVYDSAGHDLGRDNSRWNDVHRTLRGEYGARSTRDDPNDEMSSVMYVAAPIRDGQGRIAGVLTVSKPNRSIQPFIERSQDVILRWGWVLLGSALLVGLLVAWWLSRQLAGLRRYADAVSAGQRASLPARGIEKPAGEFADLGRALESMRRQLDGKQYVEQYVHSLTHELKSPLAAIRGAAELLEGEMPAEQRQRFVANIASEGARLQQLIERLLNLALVEQRQGLEERVAVDLHGLAEELLQAQAARIQAAGLRMENAIPPGLLVQGERFLLRQALANLLDNALDFTPAGGLLRFSAETRDGRVELALYNQGAAIPDYALPRLTERFYSLPRPASGRKSTGLGLNFVQEVALLHGGELALRNVEGGVRASLLLPI